MMHFKYRLHLCLVALTSWYTNVVKKCRGPTNVAFYVRFALMWHRTNVVSHRTKDMAS